MRTKIKLPILSIFIFFIMVSCQNNNWTPEEQKDFLSGCTTGAIGDTVPSESDYEKKLLIVTDICECTLEASQKKYNSPLEMSEDEDSGLFMEFISGNCAKKWEGSP